MLQPFGRDPEAREVGPRLRAVDLRRPRGGAGQLHGLQAAAHMEGMSMGRPSELW